MTLAERLPLGGPPMPAEVARRTRAGSTRLRRILVASDAVALALAWTIPFLFTRPDRIDTAGVIATCVAVSLVVLAGRGLYKSRVTVVRAIELSRVALTTLTAGVVAYAILWIAPIGGRLTITEAVAGALLSALGLTISRGGYRNWLARCRADGRFHRPVLIVGTDGEAKRLVDLLEANPELGFSVAGVLGYPGQAANVGIDVDRLLVGSIENASFHVARSGVSAVIVVESAIGATERGAVIRRLLATGVHVLMTSPLRGVDERRVRMQPLAREPLVYLEPAVLQPWQLAVKRFMDVTAAVALLALLSPLLGVAAAAIKLSDRGPVLTWLDRVGRDGRPYRTATLRTVVTDDRLDGLGRPELISPRPLWSDETRTPVGRVLEATCLNEIPQLWSVVRGDTSFVGPRPVPAGSGTSGVTTLRPGLTGLWRVETRYGEDGRGSYLDDYYIENWSGPLDVVIILSTMDNLLSRLWFGESWRRLPPSVGSGNGSVRPDHEPSARAS